MGFGWSVQHLLGEVKQILCLWTLDLQGLPLSEDQVLVNPLSLRICDDNALCIAVDNCGEVLILRGLGVGVELAPLRWSLSSIRIFPYMLCPSACPLECIRHIGPNFCIACCKQSILEYFILLGQPCNYGTKLLCPPFVPRSRI